MKDYIERMIKEAIELGSRIEKLKEYRNTHSDLHRAEYMLMGEQQSSMEDYIMTLERRIGLAVINEAKEQNNEASKTK